MEGEIAGDASDPRRHCVDAPDGRRRVYYLAPGDDGEPSAAGSEFHRQSAGVPRTLVVAMHGGGESALGFHASSGFSELASLHGFVLAYPEGIGESSPGDPDRVRRRSWNAGRCCGPARRDGVDDVGFIAALVDRVGAAAGIDPQRTYAVGHSNGGMLAFRLALECPGLFAGVGVQSASIAVDTAGPSVATHLVAVHGGSDRHHPVDGGRGPDSSVESPYRSVREACARFASVGGAEVELIEVPEGTHSWMGRRSAETARGALEAGRRVAGGTPFAGFETAEVIWDFLSRTPPAQMLPAVLGD